VVEHEVMVEVWTQLVVIVGFISVVDETVEMVEIEVK
jgi:hypothetical protein